MFKKITNNKKWKSLLKEQISTELRMAIKLFFLKDNIDYEKFYQNSRANDICNSGVGLEAWEIANNLSVSKKENEVNCTPTFRKHFANNILHRSSKVPDWFYIAYPDVEVWFHSRMSEYEDEISSNMSKYFLKGYFTNEFYKLIINEFLKENSSLECSI